MASNLKSKLSDILAHLESLYAPAKKLQNQNLADIIATAKGRIQQLSQHPDLELLDREHGGQLDQTVNPNGTPAVHGDGTRKYDDNGLPLAPRMPFDPNAGDAIAPDAAKPTPGYTINTPGSQVGGPDQRKDDVHVPGEPRFDRPNQNFQQPNAVDLNADGTMRQAPNSLGAQPDVRK